MIAISTRIKSIISPSISLQGKYTLWMNYLLVVYAFFLPISHHANAQAQFAIIVLFFLRGQYYTYFKEALSNRVIQAFILYFFIYIVWLIGTENFDYARTLISHNKYALFFPALILSFLDKRFIIHVIFGFLFGVLFSEIISYLVSFKVLPWQLFLFGKEAYTCFSPTDPSPFMHHSHYGLTLALAVTFLILNLLTQHVSLKERLISGFFVLTATINLSITGGRIGYITYIILLLMTIILIYKKKALIPLALMLFFISSIGITAYNFSPLFKSRINQSLHTIDTMSKNPTNYNSSFGNRVGVWHYAFQTIKDAPLLGVGTGDHKDEYRSRIPALDSNLLAVSHPHNQFISVTLQFGFLGLIIFLNIFFQIFRYKFPNNYQMSIAYLTAVAFILTFMIEGDIVKYYMSLFTLMIGISMVSKTYKIDVISTRKTAFTYIGLISIGFLLAYLI